jgi:hypothetical protein
MGAKVIGTSNCADERGLRCNMMILHTPPPPPPPPPPPLSHSPPRLRSVRSSVLRASRRPCRRILRLEGHAAAARGGLGCRLCQGGVDMGEHQAPREYSRVFGCGKRGAGGPPCDIHRACSGVRLVQGHSPPPKHRRSSLRKTASALERRIQVPAPPALPPHCGLVIRVTASRAAAATARALMHLHAHAPPIIHRLCHFACAFVTLLPATGCSAAFAFSSSSCSRCDSPQGCQARKYHRVERWKQVRSRALPAKH